VSPTALFLKNFPSSDWSEYAGALHFKCLKNIQAGLLIIVISISFAPSIGFRPFSSTGILACSAPHQLLYRTFIPLEAI